MPLIWIILAAIGAHWFLEQRHEKLQVRIVPADPPGPPPDSAVSQSPTDSPPIVVPTQEQQYAGTVQGAVPPPLVPIPGAE